MTEENSSEIRVFGPVHYFSAFTHSIQLSCKQYFKLCSVCKRFFIQEFKKTFSLTVNSTEIKKERNSSNINSVWWCLVIDGLRLFVVITG